MFDTRRRRNLAPAWLLPLLLIPEAVWAQELPTSLSLQDPPRDLTELSIDELLQVEITSVSRRGMALIDAPSAITVIRTDDLKRTGATSIAEALRMVPGVQVAKIDSNKWAVSSRGFNGRFSNKLQVLQDGRSVYSPLFSGVFWDQFDTLMADIERIEVIRGPGSTVWGSNAVNGVINVITKHSAQTQGGVGRAGGGTEQLGFGEARWGGRSGEDLTYRVFAKGFATGSGKNGDDDWWYGRGGFRTDFGRDADTFAVQGEYYQGRTNGGQTLTIYPGVAPQTFVDGIDNSGGYVRGAWTHRFSETAVLDVDLSYTRSVLRSTLLEETRDTVELGLTQRFRIGDAHQLVAGAGYRLSADDIRPGPTISFDPATDTVGLASAFVQDEISLVRDRLKLTLGSKFEYNEYTGLEIQPGATIAWKPHDDHSIWMSLMRAVRTPSRAEEDVRIDFAVIPGAPDTILSFLGNGDFHSEELLAWELGYRTRPFENLTIDVAGFVNRYDELRTMEPGAPFGEAAPAPPHAVQPFFASNLLRGTTWGVELAVSWKPLPDWTLHGNYAYLHMDLEPDAESLNPGASSDEGRNPRNQAYLRSSFDLGERVTLDLVGRYVDRLPQDGIDAYVEADIRLGWKATDALELEIVGQNLLHSAHLEFADTQLDTQATEVQRGVYASLTWKF
jgi:iron complex outermembrane receptor protein